MVDNSESNEIHQEVVLDVNGDTSKNCDEESDTKDSVPLLKKVSLLNFSFLLNKKLIEIKKKKNYDKFMILFVCFVFNYPLSI
jgi:hypothetical protein